MGIEWLNQIVEILASAGIRADEAYPGGKWTELSGPVAAVSLKDLNYRERTAEFEIRIISPRVLGGWQCQHIAAEAVAALEGAGITCRMEPMRYQAGTDCFEMAVIGTKYVFAAEEEIAVPDAFEVLVGEETVNYVTEFSGTQDRQRRLIGSIELQTPVGITPATGGWSIRMVQVIPRGGQITAEPVEPFELTVKETGLSTVYSGCGWNVVKKQMDQSQTKLIWEGFALTREETADG